MELTWERVRAWRLARHALDARAPRAALLDVVGRLCGVHAQLMSSAELSLWARVDDLEPDAVGRALWEERALVKTWAMRGTLHLLPAAELALWLGALQTYDHYRKPAWLRAFGVGADELERVVAAVARALDGRMLTREALADEVAAATGSPGLGEKLRESWGALLKPAAFQGQLCFAPGEGQAVRFTRPASWVGAVAPLDGESALREVTRRYLGAYGPARREDYARWWGGSPAQAGRRIAALGDEVIAVDVEGTSGWLLAEHADAARAAALPAEDAAVRLLPGFDQWVVGASRAALALLGGDVAARIYRPQGWISPVVLVHGRMDGVWRHERRGGRLEVRIEPFLALPAWAREAAEAEAERLAAFLGGELALRWDP